jgi:FAD/FMN-containing dehydrogenase
MRVSADEHPDLFWALRGGGGNFGVVVEFEFRLHPIGTRTLVAELTFPLDRAAAPLRGWRDLAEQAPRPATLTAEISGDTVTLEYVWVGDPEAGRSLLPALRSIGVPDHEAVRELSYLALQTRDDSVEGHSYRRYWKGHYLPELSDSAIGALLDCDLTDPMSPGVGLPAYVNALSDQGASGVRLAYPDTDRARLTAVKDIYDPDNVFHLNHNIAPSS